MTMRAPPPLIVLVLVAASCCCWLSSSCVTSAAAQQDKDHIDLVRDDASDAAAKDIVQSLSSNEAPGNSATATSSNDRGDGDAEGISTRQRLLRHALDISPAARRRLTASAMLKVQEPLLFGGDLGLYDLINGNSSNTTADNTTCAYPCSLTNGCICNHTDVRVGSDGQNYGTCTACAAGYGGYDCMSIVLNCLNGGDDVHTANNHTHCQCTDSWTGPSCGILQCTNSVGGKGPNSIREVNPETHMCDECEPGYGGMGCEMCTTNKQCPTGSHCNTSLIAQGTSKEFLCEMTSKLWINLMGDGRKGVKGYIKMTCDKPSGFNNTGVQDGTCYLTVMREEPDAAFLDPFFYGTLVNCTMKLTEKTVKAVIEPQPASAENVRWIDTGLLWTLCVFIGLLAFKPERFALLRLVTPRALWGQKNRERAFHLASATVVALLVFFILFSAFFGHVDKSPSTTKRFVTYDCLRSKTVCAATPKNGSYDPNCKTSMMGIFFLPHMTGASHMQCDYVTGECVYVHTDLGKTGIPVKCKAAECADHNTTVAITAKPDQHSVPAGAVAGGLVFLFAAAAAVHYYFQRSAFKSIQKEFQRFDAEFQQQQQAASSRAARGLHNTDDQQFPATNKPPLVPEPAALSPSVRSPLLSKNTSANSVGGDANANSNGDNSPCRSPLHAPGTASQHCVLEAKQLCYYVRDSSGTERTILDQISLSLRSGEALALMGPSGAGKTTLLDMLAQREKSGRCAGVISVNGCPITAQNERIFKRMTGYVAQEDCLIPALSVEDTIFFAGRLKLPSPIADSEIHQLVDDVIQQLGLQRCRHTSVGQEHARGISGGERRRVSIAVELIANPRVLFLDEPTSGLDSVSAHEVIKAIATLTRENNASKMFSLFGYQPAVIFSVHQPSSDMYDLFDRAALLSGGSLLYYGPADVAVRHMHWVCFNAASADATAPMNSGSVASMGRSEGSPLSEMQLQPRQYSDLSDNNTALVPLQRDEQEQQQQEQDSNRSKKSVAELPSNNSNHLKRGNPAELLLSMQHIATPCEYAAMKRHPSPAAQVELDSVPPPRFSVLELTERNLRYYPNVWQQMGLLARRTWRSLMGSFYLISSHAFAAVFLTVVLTQMYSEQKLDLSGTQNKAGMITFLLLVVAFSSLSALELFIAEKKLFALERENGYYSTLPYFVVKVLFDFIPMRIVPTVLISALIYFPMGLRGDSGSYFVWFVSITTVFSLFVTSCCLSIAILAPSFGSAALFSALLILWNTAFGGLMIQAKSIPSGFKPFQVISPFYYAFEALMINELQDQNCVFDPANSEGHSANVIVPISCNQFLTNLGLLPTNFKRDVVCLVIGVVVFLLLAVLLLAFVVKNRK